MKDANSTYEPGQEVRLKSERDQIGVIMGEPRMLAGEYWYRVNFGGGNIRNVPEHNLELYTDSHDMFGLLRAGAYATKETFSKLLTFTKVKHPLRRNIYSFLASRTEFLEYQFKPVLKFLDSPNHRILIADEVGLGKTIEAGYILSEQKVRHPLDRVLVVCPSALLHKWKEEMESKFNEDFEILRAQGIREFLQRLEERGEITKLKAICSLQTMRSRALLEVWEASSPPIDLTIIDEAHHMRNPATLNHRLGRVLSETSDALLLLTATPIHLGNQDLFFLLRLLNPEEFDNFEIFQERLRANHFILNALRVLRLEDPPDLTACCDLLRQLEDSSESKRFLDNPIYVDVLNRLENADSPTRDQVIELQRDINELNILAHTLTRTRKKEVHVKAERHAHIIRPELTNVEMDFYNAVTDFVISKYSQPGASIFSRFIAMMPQRQVASCIPAMVDHYTRDFCGDGAGGLESEFSDLVVEDWLEDDDFGEESHKVEAPELISLLRSKELRGVDSKFDSLVKTLKELDDAEPGRKIIIFSYFRRTLAYLSKRLTGAGYKNVVISGQYTGEERKNRIEQFRDDDGTRIMLSSEVGSEGLDFQFCHIMFNYDLPWNPMVVEQRIGRLDRIGQRSSRILIFNFSIPGTIEDRILNRLYMRIGIFEESIGDLEAILGDEIRSLTHDLLKSRLTPEEQERRISQAADVIEFRRQELAELEKNSAKFIGHDEYFTDELARIRKQKRYITEDELKVYLTEFLDKHFPKCRLQSTDSAQVHKLPVGDDLVQFVRKYVPSEDVPLHQFLRKSMSGSIRLTFSSAIAFEDTSLDFINIHHPLIQAVGEHYKIHRDELHPVARVLLSADGAPPGDYLYFVYLFEVQAARPFRSLESIVVSVRDGSTLEEEISETLLYDMVASGETLEDPQDIPAEEVDSLREIAEHTFGERINQRRADLKRTNDALVAGKLASLERSFQVKEQRKIELLERAHRKGSDPRYIRMLEGGLRNLRADFQSKKAQIEAARSLNLSFEPVACGFLRVIHGRE